MSATGKPIKLQLIGPFSVTLGRRSARAELPKKARALLAMLALQQDRPAARAHLAHVLWELSDPAHAEASLRQCLSVIGKSLAPVREDWLVKSGAGLQLNGRAFDTDIREFEAAVKQRDCARLETAMDAAAGEFLAGLSFAEPALQDWLLQERAGLFNLRTDAALLLAARAETRGDWPAVLRFGLQLTEIDPIDERGHRAAIKALARQGRNGDALKQYRKCCSELTAHGIDAPDIETSRLVNALKRQPDRLIRCDTRQIAAAPDAPVTQMDQAPTIAVMPFATHTDGRAEAIISRAVPETLVHELRRFRSFSVISSLSTIGMVNWRSNPEKTARSLQVDFLVAGSVIEDNGRVQVSVELLNARTLVVEWAERFRRTIGDIFSIQDELSRSIAGAVEPGAMTSFVQSLGSSPVESLSQWEILACGQNELYAQIGTGWRNRRAQDYFRTALLRNQDCAGAYAGLAYAKCLQVKEDLAGNSDEALEQALEMATHAVSLDEYDPWCRVVLGRVLQQMECFQDAIAVFQAAVNLCPSSAKAHFGIGFGLTAVGQFERARSSMDEALRLSPRDPMAWSFHTVRALGELYQEDFEAAEKSARIARNMPNANHWAQVMHIPALINLGRKQEAAFVTDQARRNKPELSASIVLNAFPSERASMGLPVNSGLIEAGVPK